ncbi:MAG: OadG-related small transporter subunit [Aerococcaceae bacterium]|nr:OadG-related small transporter subunit [Aerococcaceae bacterium]
MNLAINMDHLWQAIQLMVLGMGGIFLVLGILYAASVALLKIFPVNSK